MPAAVTEETALFTVEVAAGEALVMQRLLLEVAAAETGDVAVLTVEVEVAASGIAGRMAMVEVAEAMAVVALILPVRMEVLVIFFSTLLINWRHILFTRLARIRLPVAGALAAAAAMVEGEEMHPWVAEVVAEDMGATAEITPKQALLLWEALAAEAMETKASQQNVRVLLIMVAAAEVPVVFLVLRALVATVDVAQKLIQTTE